MSNITTIIVALGEPKHLTESISSVQKLSSEIVIVDIGLTTDMQDQLQKNENVRIVKEQPVPYVELIREKTKQYAKTDYLLFLDPDEIVPETLAILILENYEKHDYITMPRMNMILGKWMENSRWWPDYQTRVFKKDSLIWPTIIHEQPQKSGKEYKLPPEKKNAILHHNYESLDEYLEKMIRYAKSDAKSRTEYSLKSALADGTREFISRYFAADGYKDGMHGFALSFLQLMYYGLVYFYFWEKEKYEKIEQKEIVIETHSFAKNFLYEINHWLTVKKLFSGSGLKNKILNKILK